MKKLIIFLLCIACFGLHSCLDVTEEMHLNKDGSGSYSLKFDMSGLLSDPMMKGFLEQMIQEQADIPLGNGNFMETDTVIYFKNAPSEVRKNWDRPDFWENVVMRMTISESKKTILSTIDFDFKNVEDIDYFFKNLQQLGSSTGAGDLNAGIMGNNPFLPKGGIFKWKKRKLNRLPMPLPEQNTDQQEFQMAKMFLTAATYNTIYHLPGKVKKTSIPNAEIDGKVLRASVPLLDIMDNKAKLDGEISYGRR